MCELNGEHCADHLSLDQKLDLVEIELMVIRKQIALLMAKLDLMKAMND